MTDKTLKDFFEVYKPKSPDEQKFVDKHVTIKHKDRNGNGDDVFNAANIKTIKRKEERHGYDSGEDEKVYEEVEELDELSQKMVRAYRDKARDDKNDAEDDREFYKAHDDSTDAEDKKIRKRTAGIKMADKKIHGGANVRVKEEVDIDELLDQALDMLNSIDEKTLTPAEMEKREEVVKAIKRGNPKMDKSMAYAIATKTAKRVAEETEELDEMSSKMKMKLGLYGKKKKMKEEVEEIDELSRSTLGSYAKKAMKDAPEKDRMGKAFSDLAGDDAKRGDREGASEYGKRAVKAYTKAANRRVGVEKAIDKMAKEELELDESAKVAAHLIKRYGDNVRKSHVRSAANDFGVGYVALSHAVRKKLGVNRLEEEQIDELSKELTRSYFNKALDSGVRAASRQWRPGSTSDANAAAAVAKKRAKGLKMASKRMAQEEVEQVDEISKATMGRYINKAKDSIDLTAWRQGHKEAGAGNPSGQLEKKLSKRHKGIETAVKKLTKEDAEQIDELSNKTLGKYAYKAASELGSRGITAGLKIAANEPTEKNFKKMGNRQKGVATAIKKLTKEDIINKAISKFVAEDHELPSIDDRFLAAIEHLPESHIATLFGLFDNLSEENQLVMIDTVATTEGVNSLIDFAIENTRGE